MAAKQQNESQQGRSITINAQYIKDLSFENPKSPYSFLTEEQPTISIALDLHVEKIHDNSYEVVIRIEATASNKDDKMFLLDIHYGGLFTIEEDAIGDTAIDKVLFVHCPQLLFPYIRRIISDITRDGGYPPLMIAPIDFLSLYNQKQEKNAEKIVV